MKRFRKLDAQHAVSEYRKRFTARDTVNLIASDPAITAIQNSEINIASMEVCNPKIRNAKSRTIRKVTFRD